jgi:hypothetical protein
VVPICVKRGRAKGREKKRERRKGRDPLLPKIEAQCEKPKDVRDDEEQERPAANPNPASQASAIFGRLAVVNFPPFVVDVIDVVDWDVAGSMFNLGCQHIERHWAPAAPLATLGGYLEGPTLRSTVTQPLLFAGERAKKRGIEACGWLQMA